jgi:hypothetical protein
VTRFIARHPLLTYALWILPETLALLAAWHFIMDNIGHVDAPLSQVILGFMHLVTGPMTVAIILPVALLRLRSGARLWPVLILPLVAPIHGVVCWAGTFAYAMAVDGISAHEIVRGLFSTDATGLWAEGFVALSIVSKTLIAAVTVGMCLLIARHKRRSGRWETIVPVPRRP